MKRFLLVLVMLTTVGCATVKIPPSPITTPITDGKVVLYVDIAEFPKHTHVGTTVFNNFVKEYEFPWEMEKLVYDTFKQRIESETNLTVVNATDLGAEYLSETVNLVSISEDKWMINDTSRPLYDELQSQGVRAVIQVIERPTLARMECSQFGCTNHNSQGHGVFTRSVFGMSTYHASASFDVVIESIDPPVDISELRIFAGMEAFAVRNKVIKKFPKPVDFKNISAEELAPIKNEIISYIETLADLTCQSFNGEIVDQK